MASVGPLSGRGTGDPPPELTVGWKTDFSRHTVPLS